MCKDGFEHMDYIERFMARPSPYNPSA